MAKKKRANKNQNLLKLIAVLILLVIIVVSFLSVYKDATTGNVEVINKEGLSATTGRATIGFYVENTNEIQEGKG